MSSVGELRVAIDVGSKKHRVGIGGADGRVIEEFDITHDKVGFDLFFQRVAAEPGARSSIFGPRRRVDERHIQKSKT